ncbi:hypothetical protein D3C71_1713240 [compost metagenome]
MPTSQNCLVFNVPSFEHNAHDNYLGIAKLLRIGDLYAGACMRHNSKERQDNRDQGVHMFHEEVSLFIECPQLAEFCAHSGGL